MERLIFNGWSSGLGDDHFARALAGLGTLTACRRSRNKRVLYLLNRLPHEPEDNLPELLAAMFRALHQRTGRLNWQAPSLAKVHIESKSWPKAAILEAAWSLFLNDSFRKKRLFVERRGGVLQYLLTCARILRSDAVGASSVAVAGRFRHYRPSRFSWPLTISTLPHEPLAEELSCLSNSDAGTPLCRFTVPGAGEPAEILVSSKTAEHLFDVPRHPSGSRLLLFFVRCEVGEGYLSHLLQSIEPGFDGECIALVECGSQPTNAQLVDRIAALVKLLARGYAVDVALQKTFGAAAILTLRRKLSPLPTPALRFIPLMAGLLPIAAARPLRRLDFNKRRSLDDQAAPEPPRFIQHRLFGKNSGEVVEEVRELQVGVQVTLAVRIGPSDLLWRTAPQPFPDTLLPRDEKLHNLKVVFFEPDQLEQPLVRNLILPQKGASTSAEFAFTPRRAAPFQGRITVLHRGRILQTALVEGEVGVPTAISESSRGITQRIEAPVRGAFRELHSRRKFDLALILNHTVAERPMLTAISSGYAFAADLTDIGTPVDRINAELSNVATSVADYDNGLSSPENKALLVRLARLGATLYSRLFQDQLQATQTKGLKLEEQEYIQIISTRHDAVVPIEFLYEHAQPKPDAQLCPRAASALKDGKCASACLREADPDGYVCPLGFWGLSKVIERHAFHPNLALKGPLTVQAEPMRGRDLLDLSRGAVFGHSKEVPEAKVISLVNLLKKHREDAQFPKNWNEWRAAVKTYQPSLLVALPHNEGSEEDIRLEIHNDFLYTEKLSHHHDYVRVDGSPYPLVILLGCDVAGTAQRYASHIGCFRRAGAAVVVSTIAAVFGEHAASVGEKLVRRLLDPASAGKNRLGELLRDVKREALAESLPMALCVVAFGDADWRL